MRKALIVFTMLLSLVSLSASAQVRGKGRIQGTVVDKANGKPIQNAVVTVAPADGTTTPIVARTDARGRWSALGLTSGAWNIDISADGYLVSRGAVNVSEVQMLPPIKTELAVEIKEEAPAPVADTVPPEARAAVEAGEAFMAQQKFREAAAEFEKAATLLPENMSLRQVLAQAHYKAGDLAKAIATLEPVVAADAANHALALLLTNMYLENDQLDAAKAMLEKVPSSAVTEATVYTNIGVLFLNKNNPAEATTYFTKAIGLDAARADGYYYRGLAQLQLKKNAEAKADFQKVLELAPESAEARDAKQLLASLK
jgi:tetratricopeptide (TPR) repeat protein